MASTWQDMIAELANECRTLAAKLEKLDGTRSVNPAGRKRKTDADIEELREKFRDRLLPRLAAKVRGGSSEQLSEVQDDLKKLVEGTWLTEIATGDESSATLWAASFKQIGKKLEYLAEVTEELSGRTSIHQVIQNSVVGALSVGEGSKANGSVRKAPSIKAGSNRSADAHDKRQFKKADRIMPETLLRQVLQLLKHDHSYTGEDFEPVERFWRMFNDIGEQFISPQLNSSLLKLRSSMGDLFDFTSANFFAFPKQARDRYCLYPELNVDRGGTGSREQFIVYDGHARDLDRIVETMLEAYAEFRRSVKETLFI